MNKQEILDSITFKSYDVSSDKVDMSYGGIAVALYPDVKWFFDKQEGSYTGDWYMVGVDKEGKYYFFCMGYGSCSGCDWLQSAMYDDPEESKKNIGEIIDKILETPVIPDKASALEYAKKFDWQGSYDREESDPFIAEVLKAIENS